jgi:putative PIN family toxin of toxin-antitoxin system
LPERVVFDTNVWISGLLWRGKPYQCLLLAHTGVVQVVYCPQMLAELSRKLCQTFRFSEDRLQAVLYDIGRVAERVEITGSLHVVASDPSDDMFIECALAAGARTIVSDDHHLLDLAMYEGIAIVSSTDFCAIHLS